MIRPILRMGDPRLLERSRDGRATSARRSCATLLADMRETMIAAHGAGLAAPQIGVGLRVVIFGFEHNERYPDAEPVPYTELDQSGADAARRRRWKRAGKAACRCRACAGRCRAMRACATAASTRRASAIEREVAGFHARVVQHECDHLDGILYPMRIRDMRKFGFTDVLFPGRRRRRRLSGRTQSPQRFGASRRSSSHSAQLLVERRLELAAAPLRRAGARRRAGRRPRRARRAC